MTAPVVGATKLHHVDGAVKAVDLKLTDEEGAQNIIQRKEDVRKKRAERNRMKRRQKQAQKKAASTSRCTKKLP